MGNSFLSDALASIESASFENFADSIKGKYSVCKLCLFYYCYFNKTKYFLERKTMEKESQCWKFY